MGRPSLRFVPLGLALVVALVFVGCGGSDDEQSASGDGQVAAGDCSGGGDLEPIKLSYAPSNAILLPLFVALERGDFEKAGLTVETETFRGSSNEALPRLTQGDVDIMPAVPGPPLFNQQAQQFGVKVIASNGVEKPGRLTPAWLTVLPDVADDIQTYADLKGRSIEGGREGSPVAILANEAIQQGGIDESEVTLTYRVKTPQDMFTLASRKAAEVIAMIEPLATLAEQRGLVKRWKGIADVMPWYQAALLAASQNALEQKCASVVKFLEVYVAICREINATDGEWTPEFLEIASKTLDVPPEVLKAQGGMPYYDPDGAVNMESLERLQDMFADELQDPDADMAELVAADLVQKAAEQVDASPSGR